jgi:hypothetical protein
MYVDYAQAAAKQVDAMYGGPRKQLVEEQLAAGIQREREKRKEQKPSRTTAFWRLLAGLGPSCKLSISEWLRSPQRPKLY